MNKLVSKLEGKDMKVREAQVQRGEIRIVVGGMNWLTQVLMQAFFKQAIKKALGKKGIEFDLGVRRELTDNAVAP